MLNSFSDICWPFAFLFWRSYIDPSPIFNRITFFSVDFWDNSLNCSSLSDKEPANIFSHFTGCLFTVLFI